MHTACVLPRVAHVMPILYCFQALLTPCSMRQLYCVHMRLATAMNLFGRAPCRNACPGLHCKLQLAATSTQAYFLRAWTCPDQAGSTCGMHSSTSQPNITLDWIGISITPGGIACTCVGCVHISCRERLIWSLHRRHAEENGHNPDVQVCASHTLHSNSQMRCLTGRVRLLDLQQERGFCQRPHTCTLGTVSHSVCSDGVTSHASLHASEKGLACRAR